jgi:hypothetical protein
MTLYTGDRLARLLPPSVCSELSKLKGTVLPDYKCLEVISFKSPLLGHVTPDIKKNFKLFL